MSHPRRWFLSHSLTQHTLQLITKEEEWISWTDKYCTAYHIPILLPFPTHLFRPVSYILHQEPLVPHSTTSLRSWSASGSQPAWPVSVLPRSVPHLLSSFSFLLAFQVHVTNTGFLKANIVTFLFNKHLLPSSPLCTCICFSIISSITISPTFWPENCLTFTTRH